jgi:hypothetical protein
MAYYAGRGILVRTKRSGGTPTPIHITFIGGAALAIANPTDDTEWNAGHRKTVDLSQGPLFSRLCVAGNANGGAGSILKIRYSLNGGGSWADLGCTVPIDAMGTSTIFGSFVAVPAAAHADVLLAAFVSGGNGVADPAFSNIELELVFHNPS